MLQKIRASKAQEYKRDSVSQQDLILQKEKVNYYDHCNETTCVTGIYKECD